MNVTKYINSIDVARYLERLGYEFSPPEAAFLVWQSHKVSLSEKHSAWRELIETTIDCPIESRWESQESLHGFLKSYIDMQNRQLERFYKQEDGYAYRYRYLLTHTNDRWVDGEFRYSDYKSCYAAWLREFEGARFHCEIIKERIFNSRGRGDSMTLHLYNNDIVMDIQAFSLSEEDDKINLVFDGMWLNIPTPFEKGDVLVSPYGHPYGTFSYDNCQNPFVVTHICNWDENPRYTDSSDMTASGYFLDDDGRLYHECIHNYLDCEYYRGEFSGRRRSLNLISRFIKGEIDIGLCVNAYHVILSEEDALFDTQCLCYIKEGLELIGLSKSTTYPTPENVHVKDLKPKYTVEK